MVSRQQTNSDFTAAASPAITRDAALNDHPSVILPDSTFLLQGDFARAGFDLLITNPAGETFVVSDYFAFVPPPNLMLPDGIGLSPEMVLSKLHLAFSDVMFAGEANSANALKEIGEVKTLIGDVTVIRRGADGQMQEVELKRGDALYQGDEIRTGRGFLKAEMKDGTRFHLGRNAEAVLQNFEYDESQSKGNFEAFVNRGGFHYKSGKIGKMFAGMGKNHSTITTPSAMIGIRGSELDGFVDDSGNTIVRHTAGLLSISDINGTSEVILEAPGNTSMVTITGTNTRFENPTAEQETLFSQNLPPDTTTEEVIEQQEGEESAPADGEVPADAQPGEEQGQTAEEQSEVAEGEVEPEAGGEAEDEADADGNDDGESELDADAVDPASEPTSETGENGQASPDQTSSDQTSREQTSPEQTSSDERGTQSDDAAAAGATDQGSTEQTGAEGVTLRQSSFSAEAPDITGSQDDLVSGNTADNQASGQGNAATGTAADDGIVGSGNDDNPRTELADDPVFEELPPDNPPTARDDLLEVKTAGARDVTQLLLSNDSDGDEGQAPVISQIVSSGSAGGQITFEEGRAVYQPSEATLDQLLAGQTLTESFSYRIVTGDLTDTATFTARLVGSNFEPTASDDTANAIEDTPITINVLANDRDEDGDTLTVVDVDDGSAFGSVSITEGGKGLSYLPPDGLGDGEKGQDVFTYRVSDGQFTDTATITVNVTGRNDAPVVDTEGEPFKVSAGGGAVTIPLDVIFKDSDLGDALEVVAVDTANTKGSVVIGSIIYNDNGFFDFLKPGETATDSFGVTARDQSGAQGSGVYTVNIAGVNDAPVAVDDSYKAVGGQSLTPFAGVLGNDSDVDSENLEASLIAGQGPQHGTLDLKTDGNFTYTPDVGFEGTDRFGYLLSDGDLTDRGTVTIEVSATNAAPETTPDTFTVSAGGGLIANVLINDSDPDGEQLFAELVTAPGFGAVSLAPGGNFEYEPALSANDVLPLTDTFEYRAVDETGQGTVEKVTITIVETNEPPVSTVPPGDIPEVEVPFSQTTSFALDNFFTDPEGQPLTFTFNASAGAASFELIDAVLSVTPPETALGGSVTVELAASDGENIATQTVILNVVSANNPPTLETPVPAQSILTTGNVNQDIASRFSDPDNDPLTFFLDTDAGFLALSGSSLLGNPSAADVGTYSVTIGASDPAGATATSTFSLTVTAPAAPPSVNEPSTLSNGEFTITTTMTFTTSATPVVFDTEGVAPVGAYSISTQGVAGTVMLLDADTGLWSYSVDSPPFFGIDTFTLDVLDETGDVTTLPVFIFIRPPDTPGSFSGSFTHTTTENIAISSSVTLLDADGVAAVSPYLISTAPANGTVSIDDGGLWTYTPDLNFDGPDSFVITAFDGFEYTTTQSISVIVDPLPAPNSPAVGSVVILGDTTFGNLLSVELAGLSDANGTSGSLFSYEWFVDGVSVAGPSTASTTFTTTISDVSKPVTVEVSFTDDAGYAEFSQDTVFVSPGNPNVSGVDSYTFIPGFEDDVFGSDGDDTVTAINSPELGDFVSLGDGNDTLVLPDTPNTLEIQGVETISGGLMIDILTIKGDLDTLAGIVGPRTDGDEIIVDGFVGVEDESLTFGGVGGDFRLGPEGFLSLGGSIGSDLTLQQLSANDGTIILDGTGTSTISIGIGSLSNHNNFISQGSGGGAHFFDGDFDNSGNLIVDRSLTFFNGHLDLTPGGTLFLNSGAVLGFDNATFFVDSGSQIFGTPGETIRLENGADLDTDNTFVITGFGPTFEFDGNSAIDGDLSIAAGGSLTLFGDDANATLFNEGQLTIQAPGPTNLGALVNQSSGYLLLAADMTQTSSNLVSGSTIDNHGLIQLSNVDATATHTAHLTVTAGTLNNQASGVIESRDDDESLTGTNVHTIDATLINDGSLHVQANLEITRVSGDHDINGTVELQRLFGGGYGGELSFINANTVEFHPGSLLMGNGEITSTLAEISHLGGHIDPDAGGLAGEIVFNSDLNLSAVSVIDLDIIGVAFYDTVSVSGLLTANGTVRVNFEDTAGILGGGTIEDVIAYGTLVSDFVNVEHNLGAGFIVSLVDDLSGHFDLIVATNFANSSIANGDWSLVGTWSGGVPNPVDDVLIDGNSVVHSGGVSEVNSLVFGAGDLDLTGGSLALDGQSRLDFSSSLDVAGGILTVNDSLVVEGQLNLTTGTVTTTMTTTGVIDVIGSLTIDAGMSPGVGVKITNGGMLNVIGAGAVTGNQAISNEGILSVDVSGNVNLDLPIDNNNGGLITVGSSIGDVTITHAQNVDNFFGATYTIDSLATGGSNVTVELDNADFDNYGAFRVVDSSTPADSRTFDFNGQTFTNHGGGQVDVFADFTFDIEDGLFNHQNGELLVASGELTINGGVNGGTVELGGGSRFSGSGNIQFAGNVTLQVVSDMSLDALNPFDTSGATSVTFTGANLVLGFLTSLTLHDNDVISNSDLFVDGTLALAGDDIMISAPVSNQGMLDVLSSDGSGVKTLSAGLQNNGVINLGIDGAESNILSVDGGLTNLPGGSIYSLEFGSAVNENVVQGELTNWGFVFVDHDTTLDGASITDHKNYGDLEVTSGHTLTIGDFDAFENIFDESAGESGVIKGGGVLDVSGTGVQFSNDGLIRPGQFGSTDVLTIHADANDSFGAGSVIEIDLNGNTPGTGHDQLVFTGAAPDLNGRLRINPLVAPSGSFTIITAGSLAGLFSAIEGTDLYALSSDVLDVTATATSLTVTAVSPDLTGDSGNDRDGELGALDASAATIIHADDGDDEIINVSTGDTVFAGEGNDVIVADTGAKRIDGGGGVDTLIFTAGTVDFTAIEGYRVESIEILGFEGNGAQTVTLDATAIRNIVDDENDLIADEGAILVYGDASDHLILLGDFNPGGTDFFDIRVPGVFEEFLRLEQNSTTTGTTSVLVGDQMLVEVARNDGTRHLYGSAGDDTIEAGGFSLAGNDFIDGRDGDDYLDGGPGDDVISGGDGDDTIVFDPADTTTINAGEGIDTLLDLTGGSTIDLTGIGNLLNFEKVDMRDGDNADTLNLDMLGFDDFVGDNALESLFPDFQEKLVIDGDAGDQFFLDGVGVHSTSVGALAAAGWVTTGVEQNYFSDGTAYLKLTNGAFDLYVHGDLADVGAV